MALIKHITIYIMFLTLCNPCMGANKQKHFMVTKTHEGYIVKVEDKVINQLFVQSKQRINQSECLILRVVLNHGYAPNYTNRFVSVNYCDFILALSNVFKTVSATSDLNNLRSIEIDLISLGEECLRVTTDYKNTFKEKITITSQNVLSILWHSRLISDIQRMLSTYRLVINNMKVENPFFTNWDDFSSYNTVIRKTPKLISNKSRRGIVYIYCRSNKK